MDILYFNLHYLSPFWVSRPLEILGLKIIQQKLLFIFSHPARKKFIAATSPFPPVSFNLSLRFPPIKEYSDLLNGGL
ncbi:MAG: hypothetical protein DRI99_01545 [Candidatus Aminicenantes bacterium]|nr:MAG: hypothetical protein DRJ11_01225 [Candidatus Aminicenantes bacterium]RLE05697.1 MAG: hypothetical protein DRI99_01545 [Candidatus Aminicenantes bacterium]